MKAIMQWRSVKFTATLFLKLLCSWRSSHDRVGNRLYYDNHQIFPYCLLYLFAPYEVPADPVTRLHGVPPRRYPVVHFSKIGVTTAVVLPLYHRISNSSFMLLFMLRCDGGCPYFNATKINFCNSN